eukprot:8840485-Pyramimonas_sp.AAC.1
MAEARRHELRKLPKDPPPSRTPSMGLATCRGTRRSRACLAIVRASRAAADVDQLGCGVVDLLVREIEVADHENTEL